MIEMRQHAVDGYTGRAVADATATAPRVRSADVALGTVYGALAALQPVTLEQAQSAALMDRIDTKYVLPSLLVPDVLSACGDEYRVLEIDGARASRYSTLYFDTPELLFYRRHHAGHLNRHKVRIRTYEDTGAHFLEVKRKDNHRRTTKSRVAVRTCTPAELALLCDAAFQQILPPTPAERLEPVLRVDYRRITLVNKTSAERVTLDFMLRFTRGRDTTAFPALVIAEVKQARRNPSVFRELMRTQHVREGAMSKYCLGVATLIDGARANRFKPAIRRMVRTGRL